MPVIRIFFKAILLCLIAFLSFNACGQSIKVKRGVVFEKGTSTRISYAEIRNRRSGHVVKSDRIGVFTILASEGDTLSISLGGFLPQELIVINYEDVFIYMLRSTELAQVTVKGQSVLQDLKEVEDSYRSKGIYYKGKPPLSLLSPFGGSPVTFFYELLSKDGKRARRFSKFADGEYEFYEISARFNDYSIKKIVPIEDSDLQDFKKQYWPTLEQIKAWSDIHLYTYIKKSYTDFINKKNAN